MIQLVRSSLAKGFNFFSRVETRLRGRAVGSSKLVGAMSGRTLKRDAIALMRMPLSPLTRFSKPIEGDGPSRQRVKSLRLPPQTFVPAAAT